MVPFEPLREMAIGESEDPEPIPCHGGFRLNDAAAPTLVDREQAVPRVHGGTAREDRLQGALGVDDETLVVAVQRCDAHAFGRERQEVDPLACVGRERAAPHLDERHLHRVAQHLTVGPDPRAFGMNRDFEQPAMTGHEC